MAKQKILVADDEVDLVETIKLKLESSGYEVLVAYDGIEVLKITKDKKPDLILLDIMMPKFNGYQVCLELKREDEYKQIPIIMLTAKAQESDKFWGMEVGADDYVTKPFEFSVLLDAIEKNLKK